MTENGGPLNIPLRMDPAVAIAKKATPWNVKGNWISGLNHCSWKKIKTLVRHIINQTSKLYTMYALCKNGKELPQLQPTSKNRPPGITDAVVFIHNPDQVETALLWICDDSLREENLLPLGFDTESVSKTNLNKLFDSDSSAKQFFSDQCCSNIEKERPTVIQIANRKGHVLVIDCKDWEKLPIALIAFFGDLTILKIAPNVTGDANKLKTWGKEVVLESFIDLQHVVLGMYKSPVFSPGYKDTSILKFKSFGRDAMTRAICGSTEQQTNKKGISWANWANPVWDDSMVVYVVFDPQCAVDYYYWFFSKFSIATAPTYLSKTEFANMWKDKQWIVKKHDNEFQNLYNKAKMEAFSDEAIFWLDYGYPHWRTHDKGRPICIPPALDVDTFFHGPLESDNREEKLLQCEHETKISGDLAEMYVFQQFQMTKLGGLLICNFSYQDLQQSDNKETLGNYSTQIANFCKIKNNEKNKAFEIDFAFFHTLLGILIIEVKASSKYDNYTAALSKMQNKKNKMIELYKILTKAKCDIPIFGAICIPNEDMANKPVPDDADRIWHFDKNIFIDNGLEKFLLSKMQPTPCNFAHFEKFVATLAFCRVPQGVANCSNCMDCTCKCPDCSASSVSQVRNLALEFIHEGESAWKICNIIETQRYLNKNKTKDNKYRKVPQITDDLVDPCSLLVLNYGQSQDRIPKIFLNPKQQECFVSPNKRKIFYGLPGTGKTLMVKLHLRKAARDGRPILLSVGGKRLAQIYKQFCEKNNIINCSINKRENKAALSLNSVSPTDHFFADEVADVSRDWKKFLAMRRRSESDGVFTVVAVTGRTWADSSAILNQKEYMYKGFANYKFDIISRGTKSISNYWTEKYLTQLRGKVSLGHNVHGAAVEKETLGTTNQLLKVLSKKVERLVHTQTLSNYYDTNAPSTRFFPYHIAILTTSKKAIPFVRDSLKEHKYDTQHLAGTFPSKIRLGESSSVLSFEFPVVIMVNYYGYEAWTEAIELALASRAIARLIILRRNPMVMQQKVDEILTDDVKTFDSIERAIKKAAGELEEAENDWDSFLACFRYNVIPLMADVKIFNDEFSGCKTFSDVLDALCNNPSLLDELARVNAQRRLETTYVFGSYQFVLDRSKKCDRKTRFESLEVQVDRDKLYDALLLFYKYWEARVEDYLRKSQNIEVPDKDTTKRERQKWWPITRIIMTFG